MQQICRLVVFVVTAVVFAYVGPVSADHFLIVNHGNSNSTNCDVIEASLSNLGHSFTRLPSWEAVLLTPSDVRNSFNATFWMGVPTLTEHDWCMALMDSGGNLLVASNDFGYNCRNDPIYTTYFEATYMGDTCADGPLEGHGIMEGIDFVLAWDPFPDCFDIVGTNGTVIFTVSPFYGDHAAGTAIERTPLTESYRGVYLSWDFKYTPEADRDAITAVLTSHLSEPTTPVELQSFSIE